MLRLLGLCLVACFVERCQAQCYAVEGETISVSCNLNQPGNFTELQWTLYSYVDGSRTIISSCIPSGDCTNNYPQIFTANLTNNESFLTITNASGHGPFDRQNVFLECQWIPISLNNFVCTSFIGVALPRSLPCEVVTVNDTARFVNCTVERSYPYSYCYLQFSRDNVSFIFPYYDSSSSLTATNETPVYYSGSCQSRLDLFFIGTTYFKMAAYFSSFWVYSETYVFKTVLDEGTTTQTSIATTSTASTSESPRVTVEAVATSPNSGLVIGLAVATGVCALVALALAIVLMVFCLRNKKNNQQQHVPPKTPAEPTPVVIPESYNNVTSPEFKPGDNTFEKRNQQQHVPPKASAQPTQVVIPEGYNRVSSPELEPGDIPENFYEEVGPPTQASAGAKPKLPQHSQLEVYWNSPPANDPNKATRDNKPKRLQHRAPGASSLSPPGINQGGVSSKGSEEQSSGALEEEDVYVNAQNLGLQNAT